MNTMILNSLAMLALCSLIFLGTACDGTDPAEEAGGAAAEVATKSSPETPKGQSGEAAGGTLSLPEAASAKEAFKEMAARQGIHLGEVPEGFPLDFLPLYPGGEIDKSGVKEGDFTLLQVLPADKDTVLAWYKKFYAGLGWSSGKPITVMGRTMTGFEGKDAEVDMTLMDREGGKTFVALVLSRK